MRIAAGILVVEDNRDNRALSDHLLMAHSYAQLLTRRGEEGVEVAVRARPEVILLDLRSPGMDGYEVTSTLKQLPGLRQTRVVAVTASVMADDRKRIAGAGMDGSIAKPIEPEKFSGQLEQFSPKPSANDPSAKQR